MKTRLRGASDNAEVRAFVRWLEAIIGVKHHVEVYLTPKLWGYFDAPGLGADVPRMVVVDNADALTTIAHEFVHYEQWRDKREMTERGVEQRAKALVRRWKRERT